MQRRAGEFHSNVVSSAKDTLSLSIKAVIVPRKVEMGWAAHLGIVRYNSANVDSHDGENRTQYAITKRRH